MSTFRDKASKIGQSYARVGSEGNGLVYDCFIIPRNESWLILKPWKFLKAEILKCGKLAFEPIFPPIVAVFEAQIPPPRWSFLLILLWNILYDGSLSQSINNVELKFTHIFK